MGPFCSKRKLFVVMLAAFAAFCPIPRNAPAQGAGQALEYGFYRTLDPIWREG